MDGQKKVYLSEGAPLNSAGAANIFLNTGNNTKIKSPDATVIHFTEKPSDLGVHINTTFSIASSKKIKLLFVLNFLLSLVCLVICCSVAFYYWSEMITMRRQLDMMKDHFLTRNFKPDRVEQSALVGLQRPPSGPREPRMSDDNHTEAAKQYKTYYVEDLGEDILLVDIKKKNSSQYNNIIKNITVLQKAPQTVAKDMLIAHFNGAIPEFNLGTQSIIGPWVRDAEVSSSDSDKLIELKDNLVTIKEDGLYLVYIQIVYLTKAPNCYHMYLRRPSEKPRVLTMCSTAGDASDRPLAKSQLSCNTQTVARLHAGDVLNIAQRESNRTLWLKLGYSYFGFVKLSS